MTTKPESANRITANILRIVNLQPSCCAARINTVGVWDAAKGVHRKGGSTKGVEDIICIVMGRYVGIEVKAGKDRHSEDQKKRQFEVERAGGTYLLVRSTDDFIEQFNQLISQRFKK